MAKENNVFNSSVKDVPEHPEVTAIRKCIDERAANITDRELLNWLNEHRAKTNRSPLYSLSEYGKK